LGCAFLAISEQLLRIERWRFRFIAEGIDAIDAFLSEYPAADRKLLKQPVQSAVAMHPEHGRNRELLRYIRALDTRALHSSARDDGG
jgi:ribosomal 50S subunit-associated protein YjgA (DUF615 family)